MCTSDSVRRTVQVTISVSLNGAAAPEVASARTRAPRVRKPPHRQPPPRADLLGELAPELRVDLRRLASEFDPALPLGTGSAPGTAGLRPHRDRVLPRRPAALDVVRELGRVRRPRSTGAQAPAERQAFRVARRRAGARPQREVLRSVGRIGRRPAVPERIRAECSARVRIAREVDGDPPAARARVRREGRTWGRLP